MRYSAVTPHVENEFCCGAALMSQGSVLSTFSRTEGYQLSRCETRSESPTTHNVLKINAVLARSILTARMTTGGNGEPDLTVFASAEKLKEL